MTQEQFLLDTLEYYTTDPNRRCITENIQCYYSPARAFKEAASEGCAIGRHLSEEAKEKFDSSAFTGILRILNVPELKKMAPIWMQNMDRYFLHKIQALHDDSVNWDNKKKCLTARGKSAVCIIIAEDNLLESSFKKYLN